MHFKKNIFFLLLPLFLLVPERSSAIMVEMPYGGLRMLTIPCNCPAGSPSQFAVVIFDYVQHRPIVLSYMIFASKLYNNFNLWASMYMLGTYNPYIRGSCIVSVTGGDCEPLLDDGLMGTLPGTGTS